MADVSQHSCGPCTRLGFQCDYDSIWRPPKTQVNKPFRRKHATQSTKPPLPLVQDPCQSSGVGEDPLVVRAQYQDHQLGGFQLGDDFQLNFRSHPSSSILYTNPTTALHLAGSPAYSYYLSYYTTHLSKLLVMADTASNPLREMIIPRLHFSPMLLKAVCAVSACHLSQRREDVHASHHGIIALKYYSQALSSLTTSLEEYTRSCQCPADVTVLTAVFLCKYEIIRGSIREWRHHLTGLIQLMDRFAASSTLGDDVKKFLQSL